MVAFKKRVSAPEANNKYYIHYNKGGYNQCIMIDKNTGSVLANCVGYSNGRLQELNGKAKVDWNIPAGNPNTWLSYAKQHGLKTGTEPKLGAVAVWDGHVASVEAIASNGDLTLSQSHYNGNKFDTIILKKADGWKYYGQKLLGFVYPYNDYGTGDYGKTTAKPTEQPKPVQTTEKYFVKSGSYSVKDNARKQMTNLARAGYPSQCYFDGTYYRIKVAGYPTREEAMKLVTELKSKNFGACLETKIDGKVVTL